MPVSAHQRRYPPLHQPSGDEGDGRDVAARPRPMHQPLPVVLRVARRPAEPSPAARALAPQTARHRDRDCRPLRLRRMARHWCDCGELGVCVRSFENCKWYGGLRSDLEGSTRLLQALGNAMHQTRGSRPGRAHRKSSRDGLEMRQERGECGLLWTGRSCRRTRRKSETCFPVPQGVREGLAPPVTRSRSPTHDTAPADHFTRSDCAVPIGNGTMAPSADDDGFATRTFGLRAGH